MGVKPTGWRNIYNTIGNRENFHDTRNTWVAGYWTTGMAFGSDKECTEKANDFHMFLKAMAVKILVKFSLNLFDFRSS